MKRRHWDSKTKVKIVLEGLSGRPLSEICNEYGIGQTQYYRWRDRFLSGPAIHPPSARQKGVAFSRMMG